MKLELNTNGAWRTVIRGLSRHDEEADDQYLDALTAARMLAENERMRALLILFRTTAASVREQAMAKVTAAHDGDTQYLREVLPGFDEIMSRIDAAIEGEK